MADKKSAKQVKNPKTAHKKTAKQQKRSNFTIGLVMFFIGAMLVLRHSAVFFLAGMLPAIVAAIVDQDRPRYHLRIVGCMNLAGITPAMIALYRQGNSAEAVKNTMLDPAVWAVVWLFAGIGWLLWYVMPKIVLITMNFFTDNKVAALEDEQDKIVSEWGQDVVKLSSLQLAEGGAGGGEDDTESNDEENAA